MQRSVERLLIGRALGGRYRLLETCGRGGMSLVFRALDETLGRSIAVKVIGYPERSEAATPLVRERFRREAAMVAGIPPHPNIVRVYDFGTDPELDLDFIVMELLEGTDLKEALTRRSVAGERAIQILLGAARGIAAGHRAGLVHRDVKPANIFLVDGDSSEVRVLDFGIAKAMNPVPADDLTIDGQVPHSPAYASPEQLVGRSPLTAASDVYQLGLVGYELLSGEKPFTPTEQDRIRSGEHIALPTRGRWGEVAPAVREVIERALDADPENRHAEAALFSADLSRALDDDRTEWLPRMERETPDRTVYLPPPQRRVQNGRPSYRVIVAGAIIVGLLLGTFLLIGRPGASSSEAVADTERIFQLLESDASERLEESGGWER